jgi:hypothetical protein
MGLASGEPAESSSCWKRAPMSGTRTEIDKRVCTPPRWSGHLETVRALLKRQPPLEVRNVWGGTGLANTLHAAIHHDPTVDYAPVWKL